MGSLHQLLFEINHLRKYNSSIMSINIIFAATSNYQEFSGNYGKKMILCIRSRDDLMIWYWQQRIIKMLCGFR